MVMLCPQNHEYRESWAALLDSCLLLRHRMLRLEHFGRSHLYFQSSSIFLSVTLIHEIWSHLKWVSVGGEGRLSLSFCREFVM